VVTLFPASAIDALAARIRSDAPPGRRYLLGIAGSPGSGKSTLAEELVAGLGAGAVHLPMDGFHLANSALRTLGRSARKGAIDTFDARGFVALLERVRREREHTVYAPSFRRELDEPVAAEILVEASADIVVVEGNYLLIDDEPWSAALPSLDAAWFCETPAEVRERRLIDRHARFGRTREAATAWARDVDGANAALIQPTAVRADLIVSGETGVVLTGRR
jgi:pantothenate kinase